MFRWVRVIPPLNSSLKIRTPDFLHKCEALFMPVSISHVQITQYDFYERMSIRYVYVLIHAVRSANVFIVYCNNIRSWNVHMLFVFWAKTFHWVQRDCSQISGRRSDHAVASPWTYINSVFLFDNGMADSTFLLIEGLIAWKRITTRDSILMHSACTAVTAFLQMLQEVQTCKKILCNNVVRIFPF